MAPEALSPRSWRTLVPGLALAIMLAFTARGAVLELAEFPITSGIPVSPVLFAIVLGVAWRNLVGVGRRFERGLQWVANALLRAGIALVGLRLTLGSLWSIGTMALPVVAACAVVAMCTGVVIGRLMGLNTRMQLLLAGGTAVCGCTAIVAASPLLKARPAETALALTCIVLVGSAGMLAYPWAANVLFSQSQVAAGILLGTSIHDTSQVVGASLIYAQQFGAPAIVGVSSATKLIRNLSMLLILPLAAWWGSRAAEEPSTGRAEWRLSHAFPMFVLLFALLVLLRSLGDAFFGPDEAHWWPQVLAFGHAISEFFLVCGMCAVGLSVSLGELRKAGWRPIGVALAVAAAVFGVSAALTSALHT